MADEGVLLGPKALAQIRALIENDRRRTKNLPAPRSRGAVSNGLSTYIAKITGSIAGRTGARPGSGSAFLYKLDDGTLTRVDDGDSAEPETIYNLSTEAISLPTNGNDRDLYVVVVQDRFGKYIIIPSKIAAGTCDLTGPASGITGWSAGTKQALTHAANGCLAWQNMGSC